MGIEKPLEAERNELGPPPGPPAPVDVEAVVSALITPRDHTLLVSGVLLELPDALTCAEQAQALRKTVLKRMRERRPHADALTLQRLARGLASAAKSAGPTDALKDACVRAVDCL